jgi:hypothetical protein
MKNPVTNEIIITLGGTFGANYITTVPSNGEKTVGSAWITGDWDPIGTSADAGVYGAVYIGGLFTQTLNLASVAFNIKPYPALVYYRGHALLSSPLESPVSQSAHPTDPVIYLGATQNDHQKWRLYQSFVENPAGILLYSGGSVKTVTLDVDQYDGHGDGATKTGDLFTVTIDYSAVNFTGQ